MTDTILCVSRPRIEHLGPQCGRLLTTNSCSPTDRRAEPFCPSIFRARGERSEPVMPTKKTFPSTLRSSREGVGQWMLVSSSLTHTCWSILLLVVGSASLPKLADSPWRVCAHAHPTLRWLRHLRSSASPSSNRPPSRSADTRPTNASVCGLLLDQPNTSSSLPPHLKPNLLEPAPLPPFSGCRGTLWMPTLTLSNPSATGSSGQRAPPSKREVRTSRLPVRANQGTYKSVLYRALTLRPRRFHRSVIAPPLVLPAAGSSPEFKVGFLSLLVSAGRRCTCWLTGRLSPSIFSKRDRLTPVLVALSVSRRPLLSQDKRVHNLQLRWRVRIDCFDRVALDARSSSLPKCSVPLPRTLLVVSIPFWLVAAQRF
jgi:hypothetical protein